MARPRGLLDPDTGFYFYYTYASDDRARTHSQRSASIAWLAGNFYVRQSRIRTWLAFLKANHATYRDVVVEPASGRRERHSPASNREPETEDIDILGNRDVDLLYAWEPHIGRYPDLVARDYWKNKKADHGADDEYVEEFPDGTLSHEQRIIFDIFVGHYKALLRGDNPPPLLLQVDGRGSTSKLHVIRLLSARLDQLARAHCKSSPVVRAAPTGVTANNINGSTLHSLLRLPVSKRGDINTLNNIDLGNVQARLGQFM